MRGIWSRFRPSGYTNGAITRIDDAFLLLHTAQLMNQLENSKEIRTFIFDVDGVLTNNEVLVTEDGQLLRTMNVRDGYAIKHAIESGYRVCIITGGRSEGVRKRLEMLGVEDIYVNRQEKLEAYEEYIQAYELDEGEILYMGDDLPDYPVMRRVKGSRFAPTMLRMNCSKLLSMFSICGRYGLCAGCHSESNAPAWYVAGINEQMFCE